MLNMDSEIVKSLKASAFTLILAFVCVALVGLALIPLLPVKLNPSRTLPGFTVRFSMPGTSSRVVEIEATSKAVARFEASTIIRQTWPELPDGVSYPYIQMHSPGQSNQGPFMAFTINAPATPFLIQQYAEEHIKTRLAQIPGIYKINLSGATPMEWRLEYDSEQLRALGINTDDIRQAVRLHYQKEFLGT